MASSEQRRSETLRDAIVALSLSQLWFAGAWRNFNVANANLYFLERTARPIDILALTLDVLLLAGVFLLTAWGLRRFGSDRARTIGSCLFGCLCVGGFWNLASVVDFEEGLIRPVLRATGGLELFGSASEPFLISVGAVLAVSIGLVASRWRRPLVSLIGRINGKRLREAAVVLLLIVSPIGVVFATTAAYKTLGPNALPEQGPEQLFAPPAAEGAPSRRVVWVVLDEWDYNLAIAHRPDGLALPVLDRLRAESLDASAAFPPGGQTLTCLPSLLTGRLVYEARNGGPSSLILTYRGQREHDELSKAETVVDRVRALKGQVGIAGFYHPYPRIFGERLAVAHASSVPRTRQYYPSDRQLHELMAMYVRIGARKWPWIGKKVWPPLLVQQLAAIDIYRESLAAGRRMATDPNLHLALVHWPVPHLPAIFDRDTGAIGVSYANDYVDNLELADATLGLLRRDLEEAGLWDTTTLIVSSDHWARREQWSAEEGWLGDDDRELLSDSVVDYRIPFVMKVAGDSTGLQYDRTFNTVVTGSLIVAVLTGEVRSQESAARWLDEHGNRESVPFPSLKAAMDARSGN